MRGARLRNLPWFTLGLVAGAVGVFLVPGAGESLQYERTRVLAGEPWRLLTGQLTHWTAWMAFADLAAVLVLGTWLERRRHGSLAVACLLGLATVGLGIHLLAPGVPVYRGASGLATTLFVLAAAGALREGRRPATLAVALGALAFLAAKIVWEGATGVALFAGEFPEGVQVLPLAHLLGATAALPVLALSRAAAVAPPTRPPPSAAVHPLPGP